MGIKLSKVAKAAKKYDHILIIMRHAKAEPFGDKGDSERELTDKGLKQAKAVGQGHRVVGTGADQISCSSVTRTRQTLDRMLKTFGDKPIVDYRISLYDGGVQADVDEHRPRQGQEPRVHDRGPRADCVDQRPMARLRRLRRRTTRPANLGLSPASIVIMGSNKPFDEWQVHSGERSRSSM